MKHTILTFGPDAGIERDYRRWAYMADNVTADPAAGGAVFRTDDDGTAHWPYVKLAWGADNTYTILAAGADAIPIQDGGNSITVDGTVTANPASGTIDTVTTVGAISGTVTVDLGANNDVTVTSGAITETNSTAILADTASMDTNLGTVAGAVTGTEMQVDVVAALPAGTNAIGDVGLGVRATGGATPYYNDGVCTETQIKGAAGQIYMISAINITASVRWLQLFDNTSAGTAPGTTTPTNEWPIPTQGDTNGAGVVISLPVPLAYGTGITFFISTAKGGGAAATADDVMLNLSYA